MSRLTANIFLLLAGALWGAGFVAQSTAMQAIGPLQFIGFRFLAATVAMLPLALWESRRATASLAAPQWRSFAAIGLVMFAGMTAQQFGLLHTSVTNSGFLTGLYVVFAPFMGVVLFRDWPHAVVWPSALVAFGGIWLLSGGSVASLSRGDWLTVLCALIWALQLAMVSRFAASTGRPISLAVVQFAVCAAAGLVLGLLFEPWSMTAMHGALPEILYAGVISGGIAFTLQAVGQRHTGAAQASILLASEAIFAALFAALLLGERLPATGLLGCALIFAAIVAVEALPALLRRRSPSLFTKP